MAKHKPFRGAGISRISSQLNAHFCKVSIYMEHLDADIASILAKIPPADRLALYGKLSKSLGRNMKSTDTVLTEIANG